VAHLEASLMTVEAKAIWMIDEGKKYSITHHNQAIAQGRQDAAFLFNSYKSCDRMPYHHVVVTDGVFWRIFQYSIDLSRNADDRIVLKRSARIWNLNIPGDLEHLIESLKSLVEKVLNERQEVPERITNDSTTWFNLNWDAFESAGVTPAALDVIKTFKVVRHIWRSEADAIVVAVNDDKVLMLRLESNLEKSQQEVAGLPDDIEELRIVKSVKPIGTNMFECDDGGCSLQNHHWYDMKARDAIAKAVWTQGCSILNALKSQLLTHGDVHPGNILIRKVGNDYKVNLIDFEGGGKKRLWFCEFNDENVDENGLALSVAWWYIGMPDIFNKDDTDVFTYAKTWRAVVIDMDKSPSDWYKNLEGFSHPNQNARKLNY
jgi:hypothetical protein